VKLAEIAATSDRVASVPRRTEKIAALAECLRRLAPDEVTIGVAYLSGRLPQGRIGIGGATIEEAAGMAHAAEATLTLSDVDAALTRIAGVSGPGSSASRKEALASLLGHATVVEASFLVRLLVGELRQGALGGIMEEAVAKASGLPVDAIRRAAMVAGSLDPVAVQALVQGTEGLAAFRVGLFRPLSPMLAQPADDLDLALQAMGEAVLEFKLDGARIQAHKSGDEVRIYSRRLHEVTESVPDLVEAVRGLDARELILDGEALALRPDGTPHSFQVTMGRFGTKLDVERSRRELPLTPFFFDLLRLEGDDRHDAPARERFRTLREAVPSFAVPQRITSDPAEADAFFEEALHRGHEGVMMKDPEGRYEAGRRGAGWLKLKPAHTLDLVVLAAEWGHGRRKGRLSNLHLGARDPRTGSFVMLGKTFKGMTDAMLDWQTRRFQELALGTDGHIVHVRPEQVVEIAFNDVQVSPHYPGGLALRFARVKRYRDDKRADEADTIDTVRAIAKAEVRAARAEGGAR
jgi:DNA ligase-1